MLLMRKQLPIHKSNRSKKESFFIFDSPAPPAPIRATHCSSPSFLRRAVAGRTARLPDRFLKILWMLASILPAKIGSSFVQYLRP